jgi:hypothetical protein
LWNVELVTPANEAYHANTAVTSPAQPAPPEKSSLQVSGVSVFVDQSAEEAGASHPMCL